MEQNRQQIPQETISRILAAAKIEEVVGDQVTLRKRGANLIGLCPFHSEKTGSFTVSPSKGIYKCFGCGAAGSAVNFVMQIENCSYVEALRTLARKYHIEIQERELTQEEKQEEKDRASMFIVNEWANKWFQDQLWNTEEGRAIGLAYYIGRGLTEATIRKFQLGYSPARGNQLTMAAKREGLQERFLVTDTEHLSERKLQFGTGLCGKSEKDGQLYDRFRDRVIYPIHTPSGKVVAFAGRILKKKYDKEGKEIPVGKYVNSPDSNIYSKTDQLYGFYFAKQAISRENRCYLVEGQMDVISMVQAGIENVVASGGTALTTSQIRLIHRFADNVTILYDGDAAGVHAALRGIDMFLKEGLNVRVMLFPDGDDPDSFARKHDSSELKEYIRTHEEDFIAYKIRVLLAEINGDPMRRTEVIHSVVTSLSNIYDRVKRDVYVQESAKALGISEQTLKKELFAIWQKEHPAEGNTDGAQAEQPQAPATQMPTPTPAPEPPAKPEPKPYTAEQQMEQKKALVRKNLHDLAQLVVRYGERSLYSYDDGSTISVGMYIIDRLKDSQIPIEEPRYEHLFELFEQHCAEVGFVAETYFSQICTDEEVNQLAISLIMDPYELSKLFGHEERTFHMVEGAETPEEERVFVMPSDADNLPAIVEKLLSEIRSNFVDSQLPLLLQEIQKAVAESDYKRVQMLMDQQRIFNAYRKDVGRTQGRAVSKMKL